MNSAFSRRHYETLAEVVRLASLDENARKTFAEAHCARLREDNTRFDEMRFLAVCGVRQE